MNYLTTRDITAIVNRTDRTVLRKKNIQNYFVGFAASNGVGRKAKLFKPAVLSLWGVEPESNIIKSTKSEVEETKKKQSKRTAKNIQYNLYLHINLSSDDLDDLLSFLVERNIDIDDMEFAKK